MRRDARINEISTPLADSFVPQRNTNCTKTGIVDRKNLNGRTANLCSADQVYFTPFKVVVPAVLPRMKQPDNIASFGISSSDVGTLALVAVQAGKQARAKFSVTVSPPCCRETMWSTWKDPAYPIAGMWQYSHRRLARPQTLRIKF